MSKLDKLIDKLNNNSGNYTYDDVKSLLLKLGFKEYTKGKTSGSRIRFSKEVDGSDPIVIDMHKPHMGNDLLDYQVKNIRDKLKEYGMI